MILLGENEVRLKCLGHYKKSLLFAGLCELIGNGISKNISKESIYEIMLHGIMSNLGVGFHFELSENTGA